MRKDEKMEEMMDGWKGEGIERMKGERKEEG